MKIFVCHGCGYAVKKLGYPRSFERGGMQVCGTCGDQFEEREIDEQERRDLADKHSKWTFRTILGFEAILWAVVILVLIVATAAKGAQ